MKWPLLDIELGQCTSLISACKVLTADVDPEHLSTIVLFHRDFAPRNILVGKVDSVTGADERWEISGILDWDECELAPSAVAYVYPNWLWDPWENSEHGSNNSNDSNGDFDDAFTDDPAGRIKRAFFDEIGAHLPEYMRTVKISQERQLGKLYVRARRMPMCNEDFRVGDVVTAAAAAKEAAAASADAEAVDV